MGAKVSKHTKQGLWAGRKPYVTVFATFLLWTSPPVSSLPFLDPDNPPARAPSTPGPAINALALRLVPGLDLADNTSGADTSSDVLFRCIKGCCASWPPTPVLWPAPSSLAGDGGISDTERVNRGGRGRPVVGGEDGGESASGVLLDMAEVFGGS